MADCANNLSGSFRFQGGWGRGAAAGTQAHQVNTLPLMYTLSLSFNLLNTPGLLITKLTCPRKWGTCPEPQSVGSQLEHWVLTPTLHFLHKQRVTCPSDSLVRDISSAFACVPCGVCDSCWPMSSGKVTCQFWLTYETQVRLVLPTISTLPQRQPRVRTRLPLRPYLPVFRLKPWDSRCICYCNTS